MHLLSNAGRPRLKLRAGAGSKPARCNRRAMAWGVAGLRLVYSLLPARLRSCSLLVEVRGALRLDEDAFLAPPCLPSPSSLSSPAPRLRSTYSGIKLHRSLTRQCQQLKSTPSASPRPARAPLPPSPRMAQLVDSPPSSPAFAAASTLVDGSAEDRRPSLSISTEQATVQGAEGANPASSSSSPHQQRSGGGTRSFSHTRSQSMNDHHRHQSPTSPPSAGGTEGSVGGSGAGPAGGAGQGVGANELVRRHHTLSTSSSRMGRLERSRARLAL